MLNVNSARCLKFLFVR